MDFIVNNFDGLQVPIFVLQTIGLISLSALLLTVNFSGRVHRHAVFTSFLCTWVIYSTYMTFFFMAQFAWPSRTKILVGDLGHLALEELTEYKSAPGQDPSPVVIDAIQSVINDTITQAGTQTLYFYGSALQDCLWMMTQVSTLNLVIHLWFTMKAAFRSESVRKEKWRTAMLLVTPYISGLLPVPVLFSYEPGLGYWGLVMHYLELALVGITSLWDIVLLITFRRSRRILRKANIEGFMSISLLVKVLLFCLFRLSYAVLFFFTFSFTAMAPSLYPLLVFCLLGLQRDVLRVWFPCVGKRLERVKPNRVHNPLEELNDISYDVTKARLLEGSEASFNATPIR